MVNDKKITHLAAKKNKNKKSNGEQSDLCDLEQVTLKPPLEVHHCLTTWLQIWYHSLLWGDCTRKGFDMEKQNCLFGVNPAELGKLTFFYLMEVALWKICFPFLKLFELVYIQNLPQFCKICNKKVKNTELRVVGLFQGHFVSFCQR